MDPDVLKFTYEQLKARRAGLHDRLMKQGQRLMTMPPGPNKEEMMTKWEEGMAALDRADVFLGRLAERLKD